MEKKYVSLGFWSDKASSTPLSRIAEVSSGINKQGDPYEFADTDSREVVPGTYPVGTILEATVSLTVQDHSESQRNSKLNTPK